MASSFLHHVLYAMLPFAAIKRDWHSFEENSSVLSDYIFWRAFRMTRSTFDKLFGILKTDLENRFLPKSGSKRGPKKSNYIIDLKTRLAIAIRYFADASPYDLMQIHDVSLTTVFLSVWGVIDVVIKTDRLAYHFPSHDEQRKISQALSQKCRQDLIW
jgi:hypothetical protein